MKRLLFSLGIIFALVLVAKPAFAAGKWVDSQKAPFYVVNGCSSNFVSDELAGGQVTLVDPMGNVTMIIQGNLKGLIPLTMYDVWVRNLTGYTGSYLAKYEPLGYFKLATITTDEYGNGGFHFNLRTDVLPDGVYQIQVAINPFNNQGCTIVATQWSPGITVTVKSGPVE